MKFTLPSLKNPLKIGTRSSPLALVQAREVCLHLSRELDLPIQVFKIVKIKTLGDKIIGTPLSQIGGKGLFTKEIEDELILGKIDIAVHSMKDMPVKQPKGLLIDTFLPREDARDAFVSFEVSSLEELDRSATVGSSSVRRRAQVLSFRKDLNVVDFRGNVQTRIKKLRDKEVSATFLAMAGLKRLKISDVPFKPIEVDEIIPAVAQGVIGIERRLDDLSTAHILEKINDPETAQCVYCERAYLEKLDGSCQTPIAGFAIKENGNIKFIAEVLKRDGSQSFKEAGVAPVEDTKDLGLEIANKLQLKASPNFFKD